MSIFSTAPVLIEPALISRLRSAPALNGAEAIAPKSAARVPSYITLWITRYRLSINKTDKKTTPLSPLLPLPDPPPVPCSPALSAKHKRLARDIGAATQVTISGRYRAG